MEGDEVQRQFVVGIEVDAADGRLEIPWPARVGAGEEPIAVVVVGKKIVPEDGLATEERRHGAQRLLSDLGGDDLGAGPEDVDRRRELRPEGVEVARATEAGGGHPIAVGGGAEEERAPGYVRREPFPSLVRDVGLRRGKRAEASGVGRVEGIRDVVEEEGEAAAAEPEELGEARQKRRDVGLFGMPEIEARAHPPDEVDAPLSTVGDQAGDPLCLAGGIGLAPGSAVVGIILGAEEIGGEAEAGHPVEERAPLGVRPGRAIKPLDDAAGAVWLDGGRGGMDHDAGAA